MVCDGGVPSPRLEHRDSVGRCLIPSGDSFLTPNSSQSSVLVQAPVCAVLNTIASDAEVLVAQSLSSTNRVGISKERTLESTETGPHHWSLSPPSPISLFVGEQNALTAVSGPQGG